MFEKSSRYLCRILFSNSYVDLIKVEAKCDNIFVRLFEILFDQNKLIKGFNIYLCNYELLKWIVWKLK